MHTQTKLVQTGSPRHRASIARQLVGVGLYLLTLVIEVAIGAPARWILVWMLATIATVLGGLDLNSAALATMAAIAPLAWSMVGIFVPGRGILWRRHLGARRPTVTDALAVDDALSMLQEFDPELAVPRRWFVLDDPRPSSAVKGHALMLSRGLLESDGLISGLAHELGHIVSLDGRLTEALNRLCLWNDPLGPPIVEHEYTASSASRHDGIVAMFIVGALRWLVRCAGGSTSSRLLHGPWAAYWRFREYDADAYAASLGQAEELARYLNEQELIFDVPVPHVIFNPADHPPVALRIERLLKGVDGKDC